MYVDTELTIGKQDNTCATISRYDLLATLDDVVLYWEILLFKTSSINTLDIETSAPIKDRKLRRIDFDVAVILA